MKIYRLCLLVGLVAASSMACAASTETPNEEAVASVEDDSSLRNPTVQGELQLGEVSTGVFTTDDRYQAWDLYVSEDASARFYTMPLEPSSGAVDTLLYLYKEGPKGWGAYLAKSDDAHKTPWSEISYALTPGHYRIIAGAKTASRPTGYRLGYDCPSCLGQDQCVFGKTFFDVRTGLTVKTIRERTVNAVVQLSELEKTQLVEAVKASAHTDVTTAEEALDRVDSHEANLIHLYDQTNGKGYLAIEYGSGDNSYGRIFPTLSAQPVAAIHDGDLTECTVVRGHVGQDCNASTPCPDGLVCGGINASVNKGACYDPQSGMVGDGADCSATSYCADDQFCSNLSRASAGSCRPAWMQKRFDSWQGYTIPDNRPAGVSAKIQAYGLASADTDIVVRATIRHGSSSQLKVVLVNPLGTEAVVYDGGKTGKDLFLDQPVKGFSGDESVNGTWILKVIDKKAGTTGTIERWGLSLGSRWD